VMTAAALHPLVSGLRRRARLPRPLAVLVVHVLAVAVVGGGLTLLLVPALTELAWLSTHSLTGYETQLAAWLDRGGFWADVAGVLPTPQAISESVNGLGLDSFVHGVVTITGVVVEVLVGVLLVIVFSIAWSLQREALSRVALSRIPARRRARVRTLMTDLRTVIGFQLIGDAVKLASVVAVLVPTFRAFGVTAPTLAALLVALWATLPLVGRPLALLTVLIAASGAGTGIWIGLALGTMALLWTIDAGLRRLLQSQRDHAFTAIILVLVLAKLTGWLGLLLAPFVAPVVHEVGRFLMDVRQEAPDDAPKDRAALEQRLVALETAARDGRRTRRATSLLRQLRILFDDAGR
jgi:predicted PurR-regulated permease PerM